MRWLPHQAPLFLSGIIIFYSKWSFNKVPLTHFQQDIEGWKWTEGLVGMHHFIHLSTCKLAFNHISSPTPLLSFKSSTRLKDKIGNMQIHGDHVAQEFFFFPRIYLLTWVEFQPLLWILELWAILFKLTSIINTSSTIIEIALKWSCNSLKELISLPKVLTFNWGVT